MIFFLIAAEVGGLVALDADAEDIVVARQDGVEDHAAQGRDGKAGEGDGRAASLYPFFSSAGRSGPASP